MLLVGLSYGANTFQNEARECDERIASKATFPPSLPPSIREGVAGSGEVKAERTEGHEKSGALAIPLDMDQEVCFHEIL